MKTNLWPDYRRWGLLAISLALGAGSSAQAGDVEERAHTLRAIRAVENPNETSHPGRYGELGLYQFRRSTWGMYTKVPFEHAVDRLRSEEIAVKHYEWIKRGLLRNGLTPTSYNIALAWNGGLMAVVRGRVSVSARDYATRVNNLAHEYQASQLVSVN